MPKSRTPVAVPEEWPEELGAGSGTGRSRLSGTDQRVRNLSRTRSLNWLFVDLNSYFASRRAGGAPRAARHARSAWFP